MLCLFLLFVRVFCSPVVLSPGGGVRTCFVSPVLLPPVSCSPSPLQPESLNLQLLRYLICEKYTVIKNTVIQNMCTPSPRAPPPPTLPHIMYPLLLLAPLPHIMDPLLHSPPPEDRSGLWLRRNRKSRRIITWSRFQCTHKFKNRQTSG